ncbi:pyridoxal kinase PdxY [Vibrio parahaemolyticus]|uniref:pyridoxal kinase PdxY n=1 Tax=Vibrio parahaemolyticus TaxID=670 RepID=UPI000A1EB203|nr:pyridoxal kinase PdxY [Vibrio parahaemolyticus]EGR2274650.1 pyridoxal kinase PdxY [Vibrio parahaemolyticus]EGR2288180.1 pyridoxal kinase PdxY [Vibrio parahaemolyticus]EGR2914071.1 pyridoxal kinase PdxY [Vibrio parahaemolyticus]EGR3154338.1 pyridoxal kinase PdxY [Vibrio parahaemolyticus]EHK9180946.1 pyridoxal kinase PdxY [Vibrio parahaemolyticus]
MKSILSIQSHVVYGHAGNSSAVFPIQRMGIDAWPIHTVQYSNHTQYEQGWKGQKFCSDDVRTLLHGLDNINTLGECGAVLSGYQGSPDQCKAVADVVRSVKESNHNAIYVCDPVMGDPDKGCIVADGVREEITQSLLPISDVIVPNQYELTAMTGIEIHSVYDAVTACKEALKLGPKIVLVKHLHSIDSDMFSMILATPKACYLTQRPNIEFKQQPVGVGDLISAVFTACLMKNMSPTVAFRHTNNAIYGVLDITKGYGTWELQIVNAQYEFVEPSHDFNIVKIA